MKHALLLSLSLSLSFAALLTGCPPPPNFLDGSVKTSHDLSFDSDELRFLSDQKTFQLSYFKLLDPKKPSGDVDVVVKVTFNAPAGGVVVDKAIDLNDPAIKGKVERVTSKNDPFPDTMRKGQVIFHSKAAVGAQVTGEFEVTFDNGETLDGGFQVAETEASF